MIYFISKGLPELIITIEEFTVLRKLIAFKIRAKIKLQITAEISKLYHGIVVDRNAILFSVFFQQLPLSRRVYRSCPDRLPSDSPEVPQDILKNACGSHPDLRMPPG